MGSATRRRRRSKPRDLKTGRVAFAAFHEAAHAACRWLLGVLPAPVILSVRKEGGVWGYMQGADPLAAHRPDPRSVRGHVVSLLAGEAGTIRLGFGRAVARAQAGGDYRQAREAIKWMWPPGGRRQALRRLRREARIAVDRAWYGIVAVAEALVRRQRLSGRATWGILARALPGARRGGSRRSTAKARLLAFAGPVGQRPRAGRPRRRRRASRPRGRG